MKEFSLYIEFPIFPYSVIYHEKGIPRTLNGERTIVSIYDPELVLKMENPIAVKQFKLLSQNWRKYLDPNLRPSLEERDRIEVNRNFFTINQFKCNLFSKSQFLDIQFQQNCQWKKKIFFGNIEYF